TQSLCEHNYPTVIQDRIYLEHDESGYETQSHECELDAFCTQCDAKLPWALYQIRELDGALLSDAPQIVADLIAEIADDGSGDAANGVDALRFRTSNNKSISLQICAGLSVFVCDNLAFRGDLIALKRKHTSGLNLRAELAEAVIRFEDHFGRLTGEVASLKERWLADLEAKALIHDVFTQGLMPVRFLPDVSKAYFEPALPEFEPRNAWSLHNAFTGVAKEMPMTTRLPAIQAVGKMFGMSSEAKNTPELLPAAKAA